MSGDTIDIDRIVREVVRRLHEQGSHEQGSHEQGTGHPSVTAPTPAPSVPALPPTSTNVVQLSDRVITMVQLSNRLDGINELIVTERAVITPAVRDELRSRKIALVRGIPLAQPAIVPPQLNIRLIVATENNNYHAGKWGAPVSVKAEYAAARGSLAQLDEIEHSIARPDFRKPIGVCVTSQPHRIACEANRRAVIRAAVVNDLDGVRDVRKSLDANLFVMQPDVPFQLHELIQTAG